MSNDLLVPQTPDPAADKELQTTVKKAARTVTRFKRQYHIWPDGRVPIGVKLAAFAAHRGGMTWNAIQKNFAISRDTLAKVLEDPEIRVLSNNDLTDAVKKHLPARMYNFANNALDHANNPELLARTPPASLIVAAGIAIDKARLMEGKNTITIGVQAAVEDFEVARKEVMSRLNTIDAEIIQREAKGAEPATPA